MAHFSHHHHGSEHGSGSGGEPALRTVRIYTKVDPGFSMSIRDGQVILAPHNPKDPYQHWHKDLRFSNKVKDEEGLPSFALVNYATGEAVKHSIGVPHPVRLVPFNPDYLDESILWAESNDTGHDGYRCIRMVNNIRFNFDAFLGDKEHGGVHDGTTVCLLNWPKGDNQRWKIEPHSIDPPAIDNACGMPLVLTVRVFTKAGPDFSLSISDGKVILSPTDPNDDRQHWIKDMRHSTIVKDEDGFPGFALINKATGEAIKHSIGPKNHVRLIPHNANFLDESILWSLSNDISEGYRRIRMVNNIRLNFDAFYDDKDHAGVHDGTIVGLWESLKGDNQRWKIVPWNNIVLLGRSPELSTYAA